MLRNAYLLMHLNSACMIARLIGHLKWNWRSMFLYFFICLRWALKTRWITILKVGFTSLVSISIFWSLKIHRNITQTVCHGSATFFPTFYSLRSLILSLLSLWYQIRLPLACKRKSRVKRKLSRRYYNFNRALDTRTWVVRN